jgi:hypothetical protein
MRLPSANAQLFVIVETLPPGAGAAVPLGVARPRRRGTTGRRARPGDAGLAALGVFSFALFFNVGLFHFRNYVHLWDTYHYYFGAKYFPELGYTGLYDATAVAQAEEGLVPWDAERRIRDLVTNEAHRRRITREDERAVKSHFTEERWNSFRTDLRWFHAQDARFDRFLMDHGYNGTPVWAILGTALSNVGAASSVQILALTALDSAFLAAMWGVALWAFGWHATSVALLYWGTNYLGRYFWTGGAFLRMDWLFCFVVGVCLLQRRRPAAAGAFVAASTLLRVFPGFALFGLGAAAAHDMWRRRSVRPAPEYVRFAAGFAAACLVLVPLSVVAAGRGRPDPTAWTGFVANSRKHLATPLTNNVGLRTLLSASPEIRASITKRPGTPDPYADWRTLHVAKFAQRRLAFAAVAAHCLVLLFLAVRGEEPWAALALGVGAIPVFADLTCYYYSVLAVMGFLWLKERAAGLLLVAFSFLTGLTALVVKTDDVTYAIVSALLLAFVVASWSLFARRKGAVRAAETGRETGRWERAGAAAHPDA